MRTRHVRQICIMSSMKSWPFKGISRMAITASLRGNRELHLVHSRGLYGSWCQAQGLQTNTSCFWNGRPLQRNDSSTHMHPQSSWRASGCIRAELSTNFDGTSRAFEFAAARDFTSLHTGERTWSVFQPYDIGRLYDRPSGMTKRCDHHYADVNIMTRLQESIQEEIEAAGYEADFFNITA